MPTSQLENYPRECNVRQAYFALPVTSMRIWLAFPGSDSVEKSNTSLVIGHRLMGGFVPKFRYGLDRVEEPFHLVRC